MQIWWEGLIKQWELIRAVAEEDAELEMSNGIKKTER